MHKGIIPHPQRIDESNISELNSMTMVFLCVDNDESRRLIVDYLIENKITFIDVGIDLYNEKNALGGSVRITTCTPSVSAHNTTRIPYGGSGDNEYATNIQISEMNALNAALAVIKWKKMCKFYHDYECEHNASLSGCHKQDRQTMKAKVKQKTISHKFVNLMPSEIEEGIVYSLYSLQDCDSQVCLQMW